LFIAVPVIPNIGANVKWIQNGTTIAGGNGAGTGLNQLNNPWCIYIDDDQTVYVADYTNHRIVEWKNGVTSGKIVAGGNGAGNQANQLNNPTAVIVDKETDSLIIADSVNARVVRWPRQNGNTGEIIISGVSCYGGLAMDGYDYLYVTDFNKHEVKRWKIGDENGIVVAGGNGSGNRLDQLNNPCHIFVDQDHSVYVCDSNNHRVVKWMEGSKEGIVVAGGQGAGSNLTQLYGPFGVVVDQLGTVYVADLSNHRVTRWSKGATQGVVIAGGNGSGSNQNQFNGCIHLAFDQKNNLYVCNNNNHRVQRFNIDPNSV